MRKTLFLFLCFQLVSISVFSQKMGHIIGSIEDKNTLENLSGVNITVEGTSLGTITDSTGYFKLTLPVGTYPVTASFLEYKKSTQYNIEVNSGNDKH